MQRYKKSSAKQIERKTKKLVSFLPRRSIFAIFDGKDTKSRAQNKGKEYKNLSALNYPVKAALLFCVESRTCFSISFLYNEKIY